MNDLKKASDKAILDTMKKVEFSKCPSCGGDKFGKIEEFDYAICLECDYTE